MNNDIDDMFFEEESEKKENQETLTWKILLVDDEPSVHNVTKMALRGFSFGGKALDFVSAYSGEEAIQMVHNHPDIAMIFLDVVMEKDDSGLQVARYIREEAQNRLVRIILRTGQPGQAPEQEVILHYDINDYKEKTELTTKKLFTTVVSSLRSYRDILTIDRNRKGLERIIHASASIFRFQSMEKFISGVMMQLLAILQLQDNALYSAGEENNPGSYVLLAGTGDYEAAVGQTVNEVLPPELRPLFERCCQQRSHIFEENYGFIFFNNPGKRSSVFHLRGFSALDQVDQTLIELFVANVSIAYNNLVLKQQIENTQRQISYILGTVVESRSEKAGQHVVRVAEYSRLLALKLGLSEAETDILKMASPLHDLGKIAVPDNILKKKGKLTKEEYEIMKRHPQVGYDILKSSMNPMLEDTPILEAAATIAWQHQERWDGGGYPKGLVGEEIHIYARITALADVFDTLACERCYKPSWSTEKIIDYIKAQRDKQFDPKLVDLMLDNLEEFTAIQARLQDD